VVTKEELLDEVWGDRFVSESALTSRIKSARQLVGDDGATQALIRTAHGRGYRWIGDVQVAEPVGRRPVAGTASSVPAPPLIAPPVPITPLIGREQEIAAMVDAIDHGRLTTAVGPPGVGKSRVANEVARTLERAGREVAFVDLRLVSNHDEVVRLVSRSAGCAEVAPSNPRAAGTGDVDQFEVLADQLRDRSMTILLDNCEHVVEPIGRLAVDLLGRCPGLSIVATSRRRLGIVGEAVVAVDPLSSPGGGSVSWEDLAASDGGRLFLDRSTAAGARWEGSSTEAGLIAEVCRHLDGLPLAIELAAARTRWLSLADLLRQLERQLGADGADPMRAALVSSRSMLADVDARAFDALSVFVGSFTIDAALAVIASVCPGSDAFSSFGRLVDHSLVDVSDGTQRRYRLLETVQRHATSWRLSGDTPDVPIDAHARYYAELVERRWPPGRIATHDPWDRLAIEMAEVLAAIDRTADRRPALARRLVGAVGWYWSIAGRAERCDRYGDLLTDPAAGDPPVVESAFLWAHSNARWLLGRDAVAPATRAHELAERAGLWSVAAWSLAHVIAPDMMWADLDVVEERWEEVVELFDRGDDPQGEAWAMVFVLGWAEACAQLHDRAARTYERAASLLERHGDAIGAARARLEIVELNVWSGDDVAAARAVFDRIPEFDDAPLEFRMKRWWLGGLLVGAEGDWETAVDWHARAVDLCDRAMPGAILANTYRCLLGWAMRYAGRSTEAAIMLDRSVGFLPSSRSAPGWASHATWVLESVAGLLASVGRAEPSVELIAAADQARRELDAPMPYWDRARYEPDLERAREGLAASSFDAAWTRGLGLELGAAFELARDELNELTTRPVA
jgi:predicted ATPase